jgi:hypothetical protein
MKELQREIYLLNLKKLNEAEDKEQYQVKISDRFPGLENLDDDVDIKKSWGTIIKHENFIQRESRLLQIKEE